MSNKKYDATLPVKSFIIELLTKDNKIMMYDGYSLRFLKKDLKKRFKSKMDKWIYRKTDWVDIAECVEVKINELKKLQE